MYIDIVPFGTPRFDSILHLRDLVLRKPLGMVFSVDDISSEYNLIHLGCYNDTDELKGTLILKPLVKGEIKMGQVAVHPDAQRSGVGQFLIRESELISKKMGYSKMVLSARLTAVPFYTKLEYHIEGDVYQEVGLDHMRMWKEL